MIEISAFTAVTKKVMVFQVVTPCNLVQLYHGNILLDSKLLCIFLSASHGEQKNNKKWLV